MQNELAITLSLYALGGALLGCAIFRAIAIAYRRGRCAGALEAAVKHDATILGQKQALHSAWKRIDIMGEELEQANSTIDQLRAQRQLTVAVTPAEIGLMIQASNTVELAHRTWAPVKGAEPMARRAKSLHSKLEVLNTRLVAEATQAAQENAA